MASTSTVRATYVLVVHKSVLFFARVLYALRGMTEARDKYEYFLTPPPSTFIDLFCSVFLHPIVLGKMVVSEQSETSQNAGANPVD